MDKIQFTPQPKGTQSIPRTDLPPDDYTITRDGQIIGARGKPIRQYPRGDYLCVHIRGKRYVVHRIVALKFIPNPEHKTEVDHIDGDPKNNRVENLRWVTRQENEMNPITRQRISKANKGRDLGDEWRKNVSQGLRGRKQSEETRRKLSESIRAAFKDGKVHRQPVSRTNVVTGETIYFHSIAEAAAKSNLSATTIINCLNEGRNSSKYIWKKETEQM